MKKARQREASFSTTVGHSRRWHLRELEGLKEGSQAKIKSLLSNTACAQTLTLELGLRGKKEVTKTRGKRIKRVQGHEVGKVAGEDHKRPRTPCILCWLQWETTAGLKQMSEWSNLERSHWLLWGRTTTGGQERKQEYEASEILRYCWWECKLVQPFWLFLLYTPCYTAIPNHIPYRNEYIFALKHRHSCSNSIHNSSKLETTKMANT